MKTNAQKNAEFMCRMYRGGCHHDRKMRKLTRTLIVYAVIAAAIITFLIS